ncbi:MAG: methyltransferase domain-containing protein [Propionibacteriales bacterium]|nr:methyltransferase domain-containing protein [Propionibacteriales bacterium]
MAAVARGAVTSPNIWQHPQVYELENRAVDPDGTIEAAMADIRPVAGCTVLDIGCGTGFHLPRFAGQGAARVVGVEPHGGLAAAARRRTADLASVRVLDGSAQALPLPDHSIDVSQARWAYFFGPGCEPGLRELGRVMRRGAVSFVVDNDATRSTFGRWFRTALPSYDATAVERFWSAAGWQRRPLDIRWRFDRRADLEAVVRIEFAPAYAERILAEHAGQEVDYAVNLWWRTW